MSAATFLEILRYAVIVGLFGTALRALRMWRCFAAAYFRVAAAIIDEADTHGQVWEALEESSVEVQRTLERSPVIWLKRRLGRS